MKPLRCALVLLFLAVGASSAQAEGFISPFLGFNFGGDASNCISLTNCEDRRLNWGAAFGKTALGDNAVLTLMSNIMVIVPAGPVQPYGIIGLGLIRPHATFNAASLA